MDQSEYLHSGGTASSGGDRQDKEANLFADLNGNYFKMLKMTEIDKCFNLDASSTDSQINFDKF